MLGFFHAFCFEYSHHNKNIQGFGGIFMTATITVNKENCRSDQTPVGG